MNGKAAVAHSAQLEAYANEGAMIDFNGSPHQHFSGPPVGGSRSRRTSARNGASSSRVVAT